MSDALTLPDNRMPSDTLPPAVRLWLWGLVALVLVMVAVGGATRLTGSGLSITEWKPVTGAVPPLSAEAWAAEFEKYKQIPQYQLLNRGMSLAEFQTIYWWEWGHRQLGRLIGLVYALPLIGFAIGGQVRGRLLLALLGLGALGGLQAAVGWIMVASGLKPGMVAVAPLKLMLHLTLASLILAGLTWLTTSPAIQGRRDPAPRPVWPTILVGLVLLQIALGGLVAGSKAGLSFNSWPLMDGRLIPPASTLFATTPLVENFVDNPALVQLNHRLMAYLLLALALWHAWAAGGRAVWLAALVAAQAVLGVVTLLLAVPLWAGLTHQLLAMAVLVTAVRHARLSRTAAAASLQHSPHGQTLGDELKSLQLQRVRTVPN
jgi:heme a synthase